MRVRGVDVGEWVRVLAPAKLNLCLSVAGPEPVGGPKAGWHRISSWFVGIDLCDEVRVRRLDNGNVSRHHVRWDARVARESPIDWEVEKDLAVRAHRLLESHVGRELPVELEVVKRIPVGGGLGGGSSDAAAALRGISEVHGLNLEGERLGEIASRLGSDVAFFLGHETEGSSRPAGGHGRWAAMVEGFGDRIHRVSAVSGRVTLIVPRFGCGTPEVYRAYDSILREGGRLHQDVDPDRVRAAHGASLAEERVRPDLLFNDLLLGAERVRPELCRVREAAHAACGLPVHLTGSGSCLFVVGAVGDALRGARGLEDCGVEEVSLME